MEHKGTLSILVGKRPWKRNAKNTRIPSLPCSVSLRSSDIVPSPPRKRIGIRQIWQQRQKPLRSLPLQRSALQLCKFNTIAFVMHGNTSGTNRTSQNRSAAFQHAFPTVQNFDTLQCRFPVETWKHGELPLLKHDPLSRWGYTDTQA